MIRPKNVGRGTFLYFGRIWHSEKQVLEANGNNHYCIKCQISTCNKINEIICTMKVAYTAYASVLRALLFILNNNKSNSISNI